MPYNLLGRFPLPFGTRAGQGEVAVRRANTWGLIGEPRRGGRVWHPSGVRELVTSFPVVVPPFPRTTTGYRLPTLWVGFRFSRQNVQTPGSDLRSDGSRSFRLRGLSNGETPGQRPGQPSDRRSDPRRSLSSYTGRLARLLRNSRNIRAGYDYSGTPNGKSSQAKPTSRRMWLTPLPPGAS